MNTNKNKGRSTTTYALFPNKFGSAKPKKRKSHKQKLPASTIDFKGKTETKWLSTKYKYISQCYEGKYWFLLVDIINKTKNIPGRKKLQLSFAI